MKKYLPILILAGCIFGAFTLHAALKLTGNGAIIIGTPPQTALCGGYNYCMKLTINNASSTQTNFPVEVSFNGASVNDIKNLGLMRDIYGGAVKTANGYDIVFSTSSSATGLLPYEQEFYSSTTGQAIYWVNMPTVANSQALYVFYGKSGDTDHSNKTGTWNSNYVAVYHLNGSSPSVSDSTSNANNGTNQGVTATTGQIDGAGSFDTTPKYFTANSSSSLNTPASISVSTWIKGTLPQPDNFTKFLTKTDAEYTFYAQGFQDGKPIFGAQTTSNAFDGNWHFITGTYDGTTYKIYFDGSFQATSTGTPGSINSTALYVGRDPAGFNQVVGTMDEVRISNIPLTSSWVATEYNNQSNPSTFFTYQQLNQTGAVTVTGK